MAKETINKTKRQPLEWEKIFSNDTTDKVPILKILNKTQNKLEFVKYTEDNKKVCFSILYEN